MTVCRYTSSCRSVQSSLVCVREPYPLFSLSKDSILAWFVMFMYTTTYTDAPGRPATVMSWYHTARCGDSPVQHRLKRSFVRPFFLCMVLEGTWNVASYPGNEPGYEATWNETVFSVIPLSMAWTCSPSLPHMQSSSAALLSVMTPLPPRCSQPSSYPVAQ